MREFKTFLIAKEVKKETEILNKKRKYKNYLEI